MADELAVVPKGILTLLESVSEAFELVNDLGAPHTSESLSDLHERLLVTRSAMSRVSELVGQMFRLRSKVKQIMVDREGVLEEAESHALTSESKKVFTEDFSSAKERNAKLASKTVDERYNVRYAQKVYLDVDAAYEYSKGRLWELDRAVRDIDTRLKIMSYEPNIS